MSYRPYFCKSGGAAEFDDAPATPSDIAFRSTFKTAQAFTPTQVSSEATTDRGIEGPVELVCLQKLT